MFVRDYTDKFEELYHYAKDMYPTEEAKIDKFRDGLHVSLRGKLNLYAGTTFRGWVEKAMEQDLDKELESASRSKPYQQEGSSRQPWRGSQSRRSRFAPYSRSNVRSGGNFRPQGSQMSVRPPVPMFRPGSFGIALRGGVTLPWCNLCKTNHLGSCARSNVCCFKCNELGHYARECTKGMFGEPSVQGSKIGRAHV